MSLGREKEPEHKTDKVSTGEGDVCGGQQALIYRGTPY